MIDEQHWRDLRRLFASTFSSSFHFSVASAGSSGEPWVTPVGTVLLGEPGRAIYFEMYTQRLGARLAADPRVCIMAVDSGRLLWLEALVRARFRRLPAVRLRGRASASTRQATTKERSRVLRRLGGAQRLPGGRRLWPNLDSPVRDLWIEHVDPIGLGGLAKGL